jgi:release factor glutamine methyltransferase
MTILEVIQRTTPYFEKHGVESPRLTIELLLGHLLGKRRLDLYLEFERPLDDERLRALRALVKRRAEGEPLQYVTGEAEFCGLKFAVDRRVLIPRPETELLVEAVAVRQPRSVVDLCTGSGCIAVALAKRLPTAEIVATDVSVEAVAVAETNARRHGVEKKTRFFQGDLLDALPNSLTVEAIVSNPPYIASGELAKLPKEIRDFEPVPALEAGEDGLKFYRRILTDARRFLSPGGFVALELGAGQSATVRQLGTERGFTVVDVVKDLQGHDRVMVMQ